MSNVIWTPSLVEERLVEAADILRRLPNQSIRGYFNTWPTYVSAAVVCHATAHVSAGHRW